MCTIVGLCVGCSSSHGADDASVDGEVDGEVDERDGGGESDAGASVDAGPIVRPDSGPRDPGAEPPPGRAVCGGMVCADGEECCLLDARCVPIGDASCVAPADTGLVLPCAKASDCDPGSYCELPPSWGGRACAGFVGSCTTFPTACGPSPTEVCGCDGRNYPGPCEARAAGVLTTGEGACGAPAHDAGNYMCVPGGLCADNWYCDDSIGWCRMIDPVIACGIDAQCPEGQYCCGFYGQCVSLHRPESTCAVPPPETAVSCADNLDCARYEGSIWGKSHLYYCAGEGCGPDAGGCRRIPARCPGELERVCGCDGEDYLNPCYAALAGVRVAHAGDCD